MLSPLYLPALAVPLSLEIDLIKCVLARGGEKRTVEGTEGRYNLPILTLLAIKCPAYQSEI